ncbi:MAG: nuclear transport factor 2 family protein [Bacteroidales bacterium]|nr:nuclear transport factor 2 family protein [Bacteroidales bacterium]
MKKLLILLMICMIMAGYACRKEIDIEQEKAAVIEVLNAEGSTYAANDLEGVFALHIQDDLATRFDGGRIYKGWDEIRSLYENYIERNSQDSAWTNPRNIKENIILKVTGNTAWLICDNIWEYEYNNEPQESTNIQIAFFEKIDGEWKFSFNAFIQQPSVVQ